MTLGLAKRPSNFGANFSCVFGGGPQLGLKILDLNADSFLEVLCSQKLLHEVMIGGNLSVNECLEGADLLFIRVRKTAHGLVDQIYVALRRLLRLFEIFNHHLTNCIERVLLGFHGRPPGYVSFHIKSEVGVRSLTWIKQI
jgi:hypothetical protein